MLPNQACTAKVVREKGSRHVSALLEVIAFLKTQQIAPEEISPIVVPFLVP